MRAETAWIVLIIAGLFETVWAVGLRYTDGFTRLLPSLVVVLAMAVSVYGLALAVRELPVGTAYAVWTGIGTIGAVTIGILVLGEPRTAARLLCIAMIVGGIVGLKVVS